MSFLGAFLYEYTALGEYSILQELVKQKYSWSLKIIYLTYCERIETI